MTYEDVVGDIARVVESFGVAIMVVGGLGVFVWYGLQVARRAAGTYEGLRERLGRVILVGLEVLIIGDIIRTIVVEPTLESVGVLAVIVLVRIVLSFSLEVEIEGVLPWRRGGRKITGT
jgi:uncharacterized membrane protein